jgi:Helix-turn-helix domain
VSHRHGTRGIRTPTNTDPQLLELLRSHYTLPQAAHALGLAYSTTYRLIVQQKRLPCIRWARGSRGPYTPSYLVPKADVRRYKRRARERAGGGPRPLGRPRYGESPGRRRRGRRRVGGARDLQRFLEMGRELVAYRKAHGRYPLPGEDTDGAPAQSR